MNSCGLSVVETQNVCKISKQSTMWGSRGKQKDKQNSISKIINESHLPLC